MSERVQPSEPGEYRLIRPLPAGRLSNRWLAVDDEGRATWVAHEFVCGRGRGERRRLSRGLEAAAQLDHPHILRTERYWFGPGGRAWALTPYTGSQVGLMTLEGVLAEKGGRMDWTEARRVAAQLLEASGHGHGRGVVHGPVRLDGVLVDRHGCLHVEHYGVEAAVEGMAADGELRRDEIRSVVQLTYRLLTGVPAEEPRIPATRLVRRLEKRWDAWFDEGLDPVAGFASADEALSRIPGSGPTSEPIATAETVRTVLGRVRDAMWRSERT